MKVTVKVKHLVLFAVTVALVLTLLQLVVIPKVQLAQAQRQFENGTVGGKENLLHLIDTSSGDRKWALIRENMIENGSESIVYGYNVFIGSGSTQTQAVTTKQDAFVWSGEEKLPRLEAYVAGAPADGYLVRAAKQLALIYRTKGQWQEARTALELAEGRLQPGSESNKTALAFERAVLLKDEGKSQSSERLLQELIENRNPEDSYMNTKIARLLAQIWIEKGDIKSAHERISQELATFREQLKKDKEAFPEMGDFTSEDEEILTSMEAVLSKALSKGNVSPSIVSGEVKRNDGTPMVGVAVYLRESGAIYHSVIEGEPYQTVTDDEGRYRFEGVLPESYQLYLGLTYDQIDGWTWPVMYDDWIDIRGGEKIVKDVMLQPLIDVLTPINQKVIDTSAIRFEWTPVEDAAYYRLYGNITIENGSYGTLIRDGVEESFLDIPVDSLYAHTQGIAYKMVGDKSVVDPISLLGFANPDSRYSWYVEAYDAQNKLITRSNGYRLNEKSIKGLPFFYLKARTLNDADRLLLDDRFEEALIAYKNSYRADDKDSYSLKMIINIYEAQASMANKKSYDSVAIPYMERLALIDPTSNTLFKLFDFYDVRKDWQQVNKYYALIEKSGNGKVEPYVESRYASSLMNQGRLPESLEHFENAMENDPSHRFVGNFLATGLRLSGDFASAAISASRYMEHSPYDKDTPDWSELIKAMANEAKSTHERYVQALNQALDLYFRGEQSLIDDWLASANKPAIKAFVKALTEVK
ncbi:carboxypeptidase-like regulatory domain-containing protein [Cohnella lupini]|uniref:Carboxypeptidase family protein n=1 Tax=Cohnella lupini TaxID=1294267 RepID=A0A3D9ITF3_9BACL|nr:carboxypeptidase-like regulatory domain-containing protein [Cohnella lupini]RED64927.1 carboxypeptidase family protein [Cohnella lupini]